MVLSIAAVDTTAQSSEKSQATHCQHDQQGIQSQAETGLAKTFGLQSGIIMLCMPFQTAHDRQVERHMADLVEVGSSQLPCLGGKVDVVAVVHLGQVVKAAGLHRQAAVLSLSLFT